MKECIEIVLLMSLGKRTKWIRSVVFSIISLRLDFSLQNMEIIITFTICTCEISFQSSSIDLRLHLRRCVESERQYDSSRFNHQVCSEFSFEDHNPPTIKMILAFCQHAETRLKEMPDRTLVIHCKAGKVNIDGHLNGTRSWMRSLSRVEPVWWRVAFYSITIDKTIMIPCKHWDSTPNNEHRMKKFEDRGRGRWNHRCFLVRFSGCDDP